MSQDQTHGVWLAQRQHGDVQSSTHTIGCVDTETTLQIQMHVGINTKYSSNHSFSKILNNITNLNTLLWHTKITTIA